MPSGKQVLLRILSELSQGSEPSQIAAGISDRVRAGFLLHGSTASESWLAIDGIEWTAEAGEDGRPDRQGITYDGVFLSDLFEELTSPEGIPAHVAAKFPELSPERYMEATRFIWLVLSSVQWFDSLSSIESESDSVARGEALIADFIRKLHHFREHPEDFI